MSRPERDAACDHYVERFERLAPEGEPGWLTALRRRAIEQFAEQGLPTTRWEEWRYTNVAPIARGRFELAASEPGGLSRERLESLAVPNFACSEYVFAEGRFEAALSTPRALSGEVRVESLARLRAEAPERVEPHLGRVAALKEHPLAALNTAFLDDGAALLVPDGFRLEHPTHVVFAAGAEAVVHPRVLVVAGAESRLVAILDTVSLADAPGFTNLLAEVEVGRGAQVELVLLQREGAQRLCVAGLHVRQTRDSRFAVHTLTLGGRLVRNDAVVVLADLGAQCSLRGLFVGEGERLVDNHTLVDHAMPHGTSDELYKGILGGESRGVFRGRVIVRPDAQHTRAVQSNPNLLLSDGAEVNTKPQLEIHADDVRCNHGSSIGQLDPEALFYLRARGLGEREAREILTRGFGAEILKALPVPALGEALDEALGLRLRAARGEGGAA